MSDQMPSFEWEGLTDAPEIITTETKVERKTSIVRTAQKVSANDIALEYAFLSMVRDRAEHAKVRGTVSLNAFTSLERKQAWEALDSFLEANPSIGRATLSHLIRAGIPQEEVAKLNQVPPAGEHDAEEIHLHLVDRYARRRAVELAQEYLCGAATYEQHMDALESLRGDATATTPQPLETGDKWLKAGAARFRSVGRLRTGFDALDPVFQWSVGNVFVATADTGGGKSALAHELAFGFTQANQEMAGIIGLELSRDEVAHRWEPTRSEDEASWIHHPERTNWTPESAIREITSRSRKDGIRFWVVDHFMLFGKDDHRQNQTEFEASTARKLERCAKATGSIILVVGQYSKEGARTAGANVKPSMHNLKGAKALADIAAGIMIIDHDEDPANMSGLYFDKNRFGPRGVYVGCWFQWKTMRIKFVPFDQMQRTSSKPVSEKKVTLR